MKGRSSGTSVPGAGSGMNYGQSNTAISDNKPAETNERLSLPENPLTANNNP